LFKSFIPTINKRNKNIKLQTKSILDYGSYCNFISTNLISRLNLVTQKLKNKIYIKGINGDTDSINEFVSLNFQLKIKINNTFHLIKFKEKFLVSKNIPMDLLLGNQFMKNYKIHFSYENHYLYSTFKISKFKSRIIKNFKQM